MAKTFKFEIARMSNAGGAGEVGEVGDTSTGPQTRALAPVENLRRAPKAAIHYRADGDPAAICGVTRGYMTDEPISVKCKNCWAGLENVGLLPSDTRYLRLDRAWLTDETIDAVAAAITAGTPLHTAAALYSIDKPTLEHWLEIGARLIGRCESIETPAPARYLNADENRLVRFVQAIRGALADFEKNLVNRIALAGAMPKYWAANAWLLEKRFSDKYGKKAELEIRADLKASAPAFDPSKLSTEQLLLFEEAMRTATEDAAVDVTPTADQKP